VSKLFIDVRSEVVDGYVQIRAEVRDSSREIIATANNILTDEGMMAEDYHILEGEALAIALLRATKFAGEKLTPEQQVFIDEYLPEVYQGNTEGVDDTSNGDGGDGDDADDDEGHPDYKKETPGVEYENPADFGKVDPPAEDGK